MTIMYVAKMFNYIKIMTLHCSCNFGVGGFKEMLPMRKLEKIQLFCIFHAFPEFRNFPDLRGHSWKSQIRFNIYGVGAGVTYIVFAR